MRKQRFVSLVVTLFLLPVPGFIFGQVAVDSALSNYTPVQGVSGSIKSVGSDTMNNTMTLWAEGFIRMYPNVRIEIEGKGSTTAPPALVSGTAQFGPMSRQMKAAEIDQFQGRYGYPPALLRTGLDMLAVYVHKDNPIAQQGLTLQQVDAIFSTNRRGGYPSDIKTWGDVGLTGEWANKPISIYGRNAASGTYGFFKEHALFNGDYKPSVKEQPGSSSVVQGVASDRYAVGYSGIGYMTADVRAVPLSPGQGKPHIPATAQYAYTGDYPLSRFLYVYTNYRPGSQMEPLRREFIRYVFSRQGQSDVVKDGYYPVTNKIAEEELRKTGIMR
jgi:phosphate transport system substrate-binding protein